MRRSSYIHTIMMHAASYMLVQLLLANVQTSVGNVYHTCKLIVIKMLLEFYAKSLKLVVEAIATVP